MSKSVGALVSCSAMGSSAFLMVRPSVGTGIPAEGRSVWSCLRR
ncbi:hypothetical protein BN2537_9799 [Streptomyces venezuelae]|nr:hypothetical protein BN2537_9799 [Streptomyces venezuelae]